MLLTPDQTRHILHVLSQHFMKPDVQHFSGKELADLGHWEDCECETPDMTCSQAKEGWYQRLSAPGFLDCTNWDGPYDTEAEANEACADMWGDDIDPDGPDA